MELKEIEEYLDIKFKVLNENRCTWYAYKEKYSIVLFNNKKFLELFNSKNHEKNIIYVNERDKKAQSTKDYAYKFVFKEDSTLNDLQQVKNLLLNNIYNPNY